MDDIRRPQQPQRRDYTTPTPQRSPHGQPYEPPAQPQQPAHHQPHHQPQHHVQPAYRHQPAQPYQPAPPGQEPYRSPSQIASEHHAAQAAQAKKPAKTKKSPVLKIITAIVTLITSASLIYFGYSLRSSTSGNSISQKIVQQAPFTVYFPSPMPPGYTYLKDSATFQIGQVFFKFSNSTSKRVTVNEQPLPAPAPKINLPNYTVFTSTVGQASVGASFDVTAGEVIAGKTLITFNTSGGVTQDELKTAINNLKVIGLSSDKKQ